MSFYKVLGVLLVLGCGLAIGVGLATAERRRVRAAQGYLQLLTFIREQVHTFSHPLGEILARVPTAIMDECGANGVRYRELPALLHATKGQLSRPVLALLEEFCTKLDVTARDEQVRRCDEYIARLQHLCVGLRADLPRREQVAFCMPITLAAVLVLLVG